MAGRLPSRSPRYPTPQHERAAAAAVACFADRMESEAVLLCASCARGLRFQSFDRLWKAFQEFLQALFISHRTYPIAYDKWVREQVEEILGLPELYRQFPPLFALRRFESGEFAEKAATLPGLLDQYAAAGPAGQ